MKKRVFMIVMMVARDDWAVSTNSSLCLWHFLCLAHNITFWSHPERKHWRLNCTEKIPTLNSSMFFFTKNQTWTLWNKRNKHCFEGYRNLMEIFVFWYINYGYCVILKTTLTCESPVAQEMSNIYSNSNQVFNSICGLTLSIAWQILCITDHSNSAEVWNTLGLGHNPIGKRPTSGRSNECRGQTICWDLFHFPVWGTSYSGIAIPSSQSSPLSHCCSLCTCIPHGVVFSYCRIT